MTINSFPPYVFFGDFQALCRSLWVLCRTLEDLERNENTQADIIDKIRYEKYHVITELYDEYKKWNDSLDEFYFCVRQIGLKNQAVNPISFDWERHAYKIHISNCFILDQTFYL